MPADIFESCTRADSEVAGVFEYADDVGYFYLYDLNQSPNAKILDSIFIVSGDLDFAASDISIRWSSKGERVGLFIREVLWAVFDVSKNKKYGGNYIMDVKPTLPSIATFDF